MSLDLSPAQEAEIIERAASVGISRELIRRALDEPQPAKLSPKVVPNEAGLAMLRALQERQKDRPFTSGESTKLLLNEARSGAMYDQDKDILSVDTL